MVLLYVFSTTPNGAISSANPQLHSGIKMKSTPSDVPRLLAWARASFFSRYDRFNGECAAGLRLDGILIATLASFKPQFVPLAALFLSYIRTGADLMSRQSDVAAELAPVVQKLYGAVHCSQRILKGTQQKLRVKQSKQRQKEKEAQRV